MNKLIICLLAIAFFTSCNDEQHVRYESNAYRIYKLDNATLLLDTESGESWFLNAGKDSEFGWFPIEFIDREGSKVFTGNTPHEVWRNKKISEINAKKQTPQS